MRRPSVRAWAAAILLAAGTAHAQGDALAELEVLGDAAGCSDDRLRRAEDAYRAATEGLATDDRRHRAARLAIARVDERCGERSDAIDAYESLAPSPEADAGLAGLDADGEVTSRYLDAQVSAPRPAEPCGRSCRRLRSARVDGVQLEIVERAIESDAPEASVTLEAVLPEGRATIAALGIRGVGGWGAYFELRIDRVTSARGILRIDTTTRTGDYDECGALHQRLDETWLCGIDEGRPVCWARITRRRAQWATVGRVAFDGRLDADERARCGIDGHAQAGDVPRNRTPPLPSSARVRVRRGLVTVEDAIAPRLREPHTLRELACLARPESPPFECGAPR